MVKRRSLDDALSPEEEAFLKKGSRRPKANENSNPKPEKKEQPPMPRPVLKENFAREVSPPVQLPKSSQTDRPVTGSSAVNARIDPAIATALLRASLERRISGTAPWTQREIIEVALTDWLKRNGL